MRLDALGQKFATKNLNQQQLKLLFFDHAMYLSGESSPDGRSRRGKHLRLVSVNAQKMDFSNYRLVTANFSHCDFSHVNFSTSDLSDCRFSDCNLDMSNFKNTLLEFTVFYDCSLKNVDLRGLDLRGADFHTVDMSGCAFDEGIRHAMFFKDCVFNVDVIPWLLLHPEGNEIICVNSFI